MDFKKCANTCESESQLKTYSPIEKAIDLRDREMKTVKLQNLESAKIICPLKGEKIVHSPSGALFCTESFIIFFWIKLNISGELKAPKSYSGEVT